MLVAARALLVAGIAVVFAVVAITPLAIMAVAVEAHFLVVGVFFLFAAAAGAGVLFLEPGAAFLKHAKIMVRELEVIFGLDAVPGELRVARHALVFLEQLGRVAAIAIVAGVAARIARHTLGTLSTATTTTAALTIIDQMLVSLSHPAPGPLAAAPLIHVLHPKVVVSRRASGPRQSWRGSPLP